MTLNDKVRRFQQAARQEVISSQQIVQMPGLISADPASGEIKRAFCKADAGEGDSIQCYLDEFEAGEEVVVYCDICGGSSLSSAVPRLKEGDAMCVAYLDDQWRCLTAFQASTDCVCVSP